MSLRPPSTPTYSSRPSMYSSIRASQWNLSWINRARSSASSSVFAKDALLVPQRSVVETQGSYSVVVVGPDNKASIRPVKTGERFGNLWVITEGVKPGEQVIAEGMQKAREGATVRPKQYVSALKQGD